MKFCFNTNQQHSCRSCTKSLWKYSHYSHLHVSCCNEGIWRGQRDWGWQCWGGLITVSDYPYHTYFIELFVSCRSHVDAKWFPKYYNLVALPAYFLMTKYYNLALSGCSLTSKYYNLVLPAYFLTMPYINVYLIYVLLWWSLGYLYCDTDNYRAPFYTSNIFLVANYESYGAFNRSL